VTAAQQGTREHQADLSQQARAGTSALAWTPQWMWHFTFASSSPDLVKVDKGVNYLELTIWIHSALFT